MTAVAYRDRLQGVHHSHLDNLNPPQSEAVQHFKGPILILAGAGTGKTRVLTRRIAHLIVEHGVKPYSILAVTFTNKAAGEMRARLQKLLGEAADDLWMSTFHSMGLRILRRYGNLLGYSGAFVVYDDQDSKEIVKAILKRKNIDEKRFPVSSFTRAIDGAKNAGLTPEAFEKTASNYDLNLKAEVYYEYQKALMECNAMDFGDLLLNVDLLFERHPETLSKLQSTIRFLLVDEFQDTNIVQYKLIKALAGSEQNILVVGDDDQSIYAFRGATVRNILDFEKDFPRAKVVTLEQNYRSTGAVLDSANSVISKNSERKPKKLWTSEGKGEPISLFCGDSEREEAEFIAREIWTKRSAGLEYRDFAIFYRTNAQSRAIEEALVGMRIPYKIYGGLKFYDRKEIKDVIAYLRLISNPADNQAFHRIVNTPTRGIGAQTIQGVVEYAQEKRTSLFDAACEFSDRNKNLREFVSLIRGLREEAGSATLPDLIRLVIDRSEYAARLKALQDITAQSRLENLEELIAIALTLELAAASTQEALQQFLDRVALTSSEEIPGEDSAKEPKQSDTVSLMTLHLAKGLEFEVVFFSGFEEGLLPHYRSMHDPIATEEERRLCYVGMTRARHTLSITRARKRGMFSAGGELGGAGTIREPSRFAFDIPRTLLEERGGRFFDSFDTSRYEDEEDLAIDEEYKARESQRRTASKGTLKITSMGNNLVQSAEALEPVDHLPVLQADEAKEGRAVIHPSFGQGVIRAVEGEISKDLKGFKVLVEFKRFSEQKKLLFKYAGLRAVN